MLFVSKVHRRTCVRVNVTYDLTILYHCVNRILICPTNKQSLSNKHTTIYVFHSVHLRPRGRSNVSRLLSFPVNLNRTSILRAKPNIVEKKESKQNLETNYFSILFFESLFLN